MKLNWNWYKNRCRIDIHYSVFIKQNFDYLVSASGQTIESGYGGLGKSVVPHSYAARVTYMFKNYKCNNVKGYKC